MKSKFTRNLVAAHTANFLAAFSTALRSKELPANESHANVVKFKANKSTYTPETLLVVFLVPWEAECILSYKEKAAFGGLQMLGGLVLSLLWRRP